MTWGMIEWETCLPAIFLQLRTARPRTPTATDRDTSAHRAIRAEPHASQKTTYGATPPLALAVLPS
jgi:hypothetical protein